MSDFEKIFEWLKTCPTLYDLWVVSSMIEDRKMVLQPNSSANMYVVDATPYKSGGNRYVFRKTEPYFFDMDIIIYRAFYADQNAYNLDTQENVQVVCDWLIEQQNEGKTPSLSNHCYQIECLTPRPFIRGQYESDSDPNAFLVDYAVTVRFYTDNPAKERAVIRI